MSTIGLDESAMAVSAMTDTELLAVLRETEQRRRADYARQLAVVAELDGRGTAPRMGYSDVAAITRDVLRLNPKQARQRVAHAESTIASHTPTGAPLEPSLPETGRACSEGAIGPEHVTAIHDTVAKMPPTHSAEDVAVADKLLSEAARDNEPAAVTRLGREILARIDQDGTPPTEHELTQPRRSLHLRELRGGRLGFSGELDAEAGTLLRELLSPRTAPRSEDADGGPDLRSKDQRDGDALAELLQVAAASPEGPTEAGEPVNLLVSVSLEQLRTDTGTAMLHGTGNIPATQARRIACDSNIIPTVLGSTGDVLDIGRRTRAIPVALRRALIERDRGCAFPGCAKKPKWCHAHHIVPWAAGGATAIHNTVLLCHYHHRVIHHTDWKVRLTGGIPEFIPPSHVDPQQEPRRNILHRRE